MAENGVMEDGPMLKSDKKCITDIRKAHRNQETSNYAKKCNPKSLVSNRKSVTSPENENSKIGSVSTAMTATP
jgi:hypothetical protein